MPQLVDALHRHAHPETRTATEAVGAAAWNPPWIVTQVHETRDTLGSTGSGHFPLGALI